MANSQFEQSLYVLMLLMFTVNGLFLIVGANTGENLINGPESFSFLPRDITSLEISGVTGTTDLDVNAAASLSTTASSRQIPYLEQLANTINIILSAVSNLVFTSYIGIMNIIGVPTDFQFIVIIPISIIQVLGFTAIILKIVQSLPIIGSGS